MRYLVLSDTHGNIRDAAFLTEHWHRQIDGVWHLGDHARDLAFLERQYAQSLSLAFSGVSGNCDFSGPFPSKRLFDLAGRRILMCHGHLYHVQSGLSYLKQQAHDVGADVVLFGHTHVPLLMEEDGVLYLNPGSITSPRGASQRSFALLELDNGRAAASLLDYSNFAM